MLSLNFDLQSTSSDFANDANILKLTKFPNLRTNSSSNYGLLVEHQDQLISEHYGAYFFFDDLLYSQSKLPRKILLPREAEYLSDGDVVKISFKDKRARTIFRKRANTNSFLITENCNSFCLMCSQPPKKKDDSFLLKEVYEAIPFIPKDCPEIGFTGGEPFLRGNSFLDILRAVKKQLPNTAVHILSNGRLFKDISLARSLSEVDLGDLMIGIPLYSDLSYIHDFIVQSPGAFTETVKGILNLKKTNVKVEIRYVIHKENSRSLKEFSKFIATYLPFVDHVAFMGLEHTGFAKHNIEQLSIDPIDYIPDLKSAVLDLAQQGITTSIYNHQLCLMPFELYPYYRKSISDWKNEYLDECIKCSKREHCGGFFSSTMTKSRALKAI